MKTAIGIDFGTLSARALLLDIESGIELASSVYDYPHGVMTHALPCGTPLPSNFAVQHPGDYLCALQQSVTALFQNTGFSPDTVTAMGVDFTASTSLPVDKKGTPLCSYQQFSSNPHAWCKLWKHHGSGEQADRMTAVAKQRGEPWLDYYGGKISSEYILPKLLEMLEAAPDIYEAAVYVIEAADWVVWQLGGSMVRSNCSAGFKGLYDAEHGYPSAEYFGALNSAFTDVVQTKLAGEPQPVGSLAGHLTGYWSEKLGLPQGIPIAVPIIDAHASLAGCGISDAGKLLMIIGTSTCHIVLDKQKLPISGINGVVKDGIIDGFFAYEAGQCCVGDSFSWYIENCLPHTYLCDANNRAQSIYEYLGEKAGQLTPNKSSLVALDWFNGVRSPLMDYDLSAVIVGLKLSTKPEEIYRALIEATAFGAKQIISAYVEGGIQINELYATGGIASKDEMMMQIYADILNLPIHICGGKYSGARGSAIYAAHLHSICSGSPCSLAETILRLGDVGTRVFQPDKKHSQIYSRLYETYKTLYNFFGIEFREQQHALQLL